MADEGYNNHSELRAISGMGTIVPTDAVITHWVNLIDGMIERFDSTPNEDIAKIIEANRISLLYWNLKHDTDRNEMNLAIGPLTLDEKEMLIGFGEEDDTQVDAVAMNGARQSEIYGGRR